MIELTWVADALRVGGLLFVLVYYGAAALLIYKAARWEKPLWQKTAALAVVVITFGYLPVSGYLEQRERRSYAKAAWDRFNKYCAEKAGEKIYKKVEGVESVFVMRPRTEAARDHHAEQFWRGDPYAAHLVGDGELIEFLTEDRSNSAKPEMRTGFQFVEYEDTSQPPSSKVVKVTTSPQRENNSGTTLIRSAIDKRQSRYGLTWADLSTDEDRKYWIAGSLLQVIDLEAKEVVAERIGYMMDPGFGNKSVGRSPWLIAIDNSCPRMEFGTQYSETRRLLIRALKPKQMEN